MSTTQGVFSETQLLQQRVRANQIAFDDRIKQQFATNVDVIKAVQAVQTAQVLTPVARRKDVDVEVMWDNYCEIVAEECGADCAIGGKTASTNAKDYKVGWCKEASFSLDEQDFTDNEYDLEFFIAKLFLKADKELAEAYAQYVVAQIDSFKGVNALTDGKGVLDGSDTYIAPAYWSPSLVPYLNRVAIMNRFTNFVLASGNNLYEASQIINANQGNANGKGDANLLGQLRIFHDLWNIDTVNFPDYKTYMLSMGSLAMASKFVNPSVPQRTFEFTRYTMPSNFLPFTYDVYYKDSCVGDHLLKMDYTIKLHADLFLNPAGCDQSNTGVLSFICGVPTP